MRRSRQLVLGLVGSLLAATALADELPQVRAGLWEIRSGDAGRGTGAVQQCIDDATFREMLQTGQRLMGSACSPLAIRRTGDRYVASIRCLLGPAAMESTAELTGDFQTSYQSVTRTSFTPPLMGQGGSTEVSRGRFLGACAPGMKAGDAVLPDGRRVNVLAQMRQMPDLGSTVSDLARRMYGPPPAPAR